MKLLAAADGSARSDRIIGLLIGLLIGKPVAARRQRDLVLYAMPPVPRRASAFSSAPQTRRLYLGDAEQVLRPIRKRLAEPRLRAHVKHRAGFPAGQIRHVL